MDMEVFRLEWSASLARTRVFFTLVEVNPVRLPMARRRQSTLYTNVEVDRGLGAQFINV